jgi:hypothetical protein
MKSALAHTAQQALTQGTDSRAFSLHPDRVQLEINLPRVNPRELPCGTLCKCKAHTQMPLAAAVAAVTALGIIFEANIHLLRL